VEDDDDEHRTEHVSGGWPARLELLERRRPTLFRAKWRRPIFFSPRFPEMSDVILANPPRPSK